MRAAYVSPWPIRAGCGAALGGHALLAGAFREGGIVAVFVLVASDAHVALAQRSRGVGAIRIGRAFDAVLALADSGCRIPAIRIDTALGALAVAADRRCRPAVLIPQALDAVALSEIAERLSRIVTVDVGAASQVALAIDAASTRQGAVRVDQALVALAVVAIANGCRGPAVGRRAAFRALRPGGIADGVAAIARAVGVALAADANARVG